jgi:transposase
MGGVHHLVGVVCFDRGMVERVRVRRLSDEEGRQLQRIVRRGGGRSEKSIVKWRRALVVLASAGGNDVAAIARLVQTSEDRVREMIHRFNETGMRSLDPQWAGGRPRQITTTDRQLIVATAQKRPRSLGRPFSRWSIRKLRDYLATRKGRRVRISRERLRQILAEEGITFQRTKTWKESPDPQRDEKLARIDWCLEHARACTFAFDEFGPLTIRPVGGSCWAPTTRPQRLRANYHKPHGSRQFYACYSVGGDELWGAFEPAKSARATLRAIQSVRARADDNRRIYVILDNLNHHNGRLVRDWCEANNVELVFTPTYASWANPIEAHFGPLREFVLNNSDYPDHAALARALRAYLKWRNANTRDPKILEAERRHRAKLRGEAQRRWGQPRLRAA